MGRERGESQAARLAGRIQSALLRERQKLDRRIAQRQDTYPEIPPPAEPVVVYDTECLDTKVFNQSITADWLQIDPAEDREYKPDITNPSRINPSS